MTNTWRKFQLMMEPDIVEWLYSWCDEEGSACAAIVERANAGQPYSIAMLDQAIDEIGEIGLPDEDAKQLVRNLTEIRKWWPEYTDKSYGRDVLAGEVEYDENDYGVSADEERKLSDHAEELAGEITAVEGQGPSDEELRREGHVD